MLKENTAYSFDNGNGSISFTIENNVDLTASYSLKNSNDKGFIEAKISNDNALGEFKIGDKVGLIEFVFSSGGFEAKWKLGLEPGPMKGKWIGKLEDAHNEAASELDVKTLSAKKFMNYIKETSWLSNEYDDLINNCSVDDFVEEYSMEFDNQYFPELIDDCNILVFTVDNSEYSIDEQDGRDQYTIYYDIQNNCVYMQYPKHSDEYYQFLGTWHASIPFDYKADSNFIGFYTLTNLESSWSINFHGNLESNEGEISADLIEKMKSSINPSSMYAFLHEIFECI